MVGVEGGEGFWVGAGALPCPFLAKALLPHFEVCRGRVPRGGGRYPLCPTAGYGPGMETKVLNILTTK